jgi:hypothetical protein
VAIWISSAPVAVQKQKFLADISTCIESSADFENICNQAGQSYGTLVEIFGVWWRKSSQSRVLLGVFHSSSVHLAEKSSLLEASHVSRYA